MILLASFEVASFNFTTTFMCPPSISQKHSLYPLSVNNWQISFSFFIIAFVFSLEVSAVEISFSDAFEEAITVLLSLILFSWFLLSSLCKISILLNDFFETVSSWSIGGTNK